MSEPETAGPTTRRQKRSIPDFMVSSVRRVNLSKKERQTDRVRDREGDRHRDREKDIER